MKKTKYMLLTILSLSLLIPFMTPARAQTPAYVGVQVGEYYEWQNSINHVNFGQWEADNMTALWDMVFNHTGVGDQNISFVAASWNTAGPSPMWGTPAQIAVINAENTTTGITTVGGMGGYIVTNYPSYNVPWASEWRIANDTANFAYLSTYGGQITTPGWLMYDLIFCPKNVNWTEFVALGNWGLGFGMWYATVPTGSGGWGANITMLELADGYQLTVPAMGWWNNTEAINISVTYDDMGWLTSYEFLYGADILFSTALTTHTLQEGAPAMTAASADFSVEVGYTGVTINWTATDIAANTYKVLRNGSQVGSTAFWTSGVEIQFAVPDGLAAGDYNFTIQLNDGELLTEDEVIMTVTAAPADPVIPGYDILSLIGIFSITTVTLMVVMKRKNK